MADMRRHQRNQRAKRIAWSAYRKWMANLVPMLFWVPPGVGGILFFQEGQPNWAYVCWGAVPVLGWLGINRFALFQNDAMRRELSPLKPTAEATFVGIATPKHRSLLDPHEDVGWLWMDGDELRFRGERLSLDVSRGVIRHIGYRANSHTILGLGRWIAVEGIREGKRFILRIEPRERRTLLANKREGTRLLGALNAWVRAGAATRPDPMP
jgi:hypothetical protein